VVLVEEATAPRGSELHFLLRITPFSGRRSAPTLRSSPGRLYPALFLLLT